MKYLINFLIKLSETFKKEEIRAAINALVPIVAPLLVNGVKLSKDMLTIPFWIGLIKNNLLFVAVLVWYVGYVYVTYKERKEDLNNINAIEDYMLFYNGFDVLENSLIWVYDQRTNYDDEIDKMVFDDAARTVAYLLYDILNKKFPKSEPRISIVKHIKNEQGKSCKKQVGYRSKHRTIANNKILLVEDSDWFDAKIILNNKQENIFLLDPKSVCEKFSSKKEKKLPKQYFAMPFKGEFSEICFVLQVDFNKENTISTELIEAKKFIENLIYPYVMRLGNIYYTDAIYQMKGDKE